MKQFKITTFLFAVVAMSLTACLKTGPMNTDPDKSLTVIEFANTGNNVAGSTSTYPRFHTDLGTVKTGQSVKFNVNVNYAGAETAPEDITVNIAVDPGLLAKFNTENGTNYVAPPAAIYTLPSTATIKKGER